jgi:ADP-heptose:LPS heptosyltransferase
LGTITDLRRARYDLAVDLFFNPRSAWLLKLAGIPRRIGGTRKWRGRLYHHRVLAEDVARTHPDFGRVVPGGLGEHLCRLAPLTHVESGLSFLDWLPTQFGPGDLKPRLAHPAVRPSVQTILTSLGIPEGQPFLLLAPGATWTSKEWPTDHWADFIAMILAGSEWPLAVLSPPGGKDRWAPLADLIPPRRGGMMPPLPLPDALAVTAAARALVTVDGGVMHASVGFDVPTLALFGPTDPGIWFPYSRTGPFRVLARAPRCHPCDLHACEEFICLPELDPVVVWETLKGLLDDSSVQGREQP